MSIEPTSRRRRWTSTLTIVVAVASLGIAACSSDTGSSDAGSSGDTGAAGLIGPIIVEEGQTTVSAPVGRTIVFNAADPVNTTITSSDESVLTVSAGYDDGSAIFNPGAEPLAPGTATVTIESADGTGEAWVIEVTVTE